MFANTVLFVLNEAGSHPPQAVNVKLELTEHLRKLGEHESRGAKPVLARRPLRGQNTQASELYGIGDEHQQGPPPEQEHQAERGQRYGEPPDPGAPGLYHPMALGRCSVQCGALREAVPGPHRSLPPLAEAIHRRVMERHWRFQVVDAPSGLAESDAHLRFLATDEIWAKSANLADSLYACHGVPAACPGLTHGVVLPLDVA